MSTDGQGTLWRRNIAENFNRLIRVHERYRQTTDGRTVTYSERELEFTFAKSVQMVFKEVLRTFHQILFMRYLVFKLLNTLSI